MSEYLGLSAPRWREIAIGTVLCFLIFIPIGLLYTEITDRPSVHPFMMDACKSAGFIPLLWIAATICAPLVEEFFFCGFLFAEIRDYRIAILVCSFLWAAIHLQYDIVEMTIIFIGGIFLGIAPAASG